MTKTTITLKPRTKLLLDRLKLTQREPYDEIVKRLITKASLDFEAVLETAEILADKEAMASLARSKAERDAGFPGYDLDEV